MLLRHGEVDATLLFLSTVGFSTRMMADLRERLPKLAAKYPDALMLLSMTCHPDDRAALARETERCRVLIARLESSLSC